MWHHHPLGPSHLHTAPSTGGLSPGISLEAAPVCSLFASYTCCVSTIPSTQGLTQKLPESHVVNKAFVGHRLPKAPFPNLTPLPMLSIPAPAPTVFQTSCLLSQRCLLVIDFPRASSSSCRALHSSRQSMGTRNMPGKPVKE